MFAFGALVLCAIMHGLGNDVVAIPTEVSSVEGAVLFGVSSLGNNLSTASSNVSTLGNVDVDIAGLSNFSSPPTPPRNVAPRSNSTHSPLPSFSPSVYQPFRSASNSDTPPAHSPC